MPRPEGGLSQPLVGVTDGGYELPRSGGLTVRRIRSTHKGMKDIGEFASHTEVKFKWLVFWPQLVLRLLPFLMPLQLMSNFELHASQVMLSVGSGCLLFGVFGSI
eukprot:COSAG01_NODE_34911_length_540_cov_0.841270_1_plen_104_part_10